MVELAANGRKHTSAGRPPSRSGRGGPGIQATVTAVRNIKFREQCNAVNVRNGAVACQKRGV